VWKYNFWDLNKDVCKLWKFSKEGKEYLIPLWYVCVKELRNEETKYQAFNGKDKMIVVKLMKRWSGGNKFIPLKGLYD